MLRNFGGPEARALSLPIRVGGPTGSCASSVETRRGRVTDATFPADEAAVLTDDAELFAGCVVWFVPEGPRGWRFPVALADEFFGPVLDVDRLPLEGVATPESPGADEFRFTAKELSY